MAKELAETTNAADPNTVYETIKFNPAREIDRAIPILLSENGKISVMVWNKFCDKVDDAIKPLNRTKCVSQGFFSCVIALVVGLVILNSFGWKFTDPIAYDAYGNPPPRTGRAAYFGLIVLVTIILMVIFCNIESHVTKKVAANISKECASISNYHKDLKMTLEGGLEADSWYIQVALKNAPDVEADDIGSAGVAPVLAGGPPPKKYVKLDGKLTLNPDYIAWKNANH